MRLDMYHKKSFDSKLFKFKKISIKQAFFIIETSSSVKAHIQMPGSSLLKFRFSEKATKTRLNLHYCFAITH